jgi:hypothetical protein
MANLTNIFDEFSKVSIFDISRRANKTTYLEKYILENV